MATKTEFAAVIAYISDGCQKPLAASSVEVYFDLLGDLPTEALMVAAKRVILDHKYATFPPVAAIREFAVQSMHGEIRGVSVADDCGEAFLLALDAACRMSEQGPEYEIWRGGKKYSPQEWNAGILAKLPPMVAEALTKFGWRTIMEDSTHRAQFRDIYNAIAERTRKTGLLPSHVQQQVAALGDRSEVKRIASSIGGMS